jgi:hypothetical protein
MRGVMVYNMNLGDFAQELEERSEQHKLGVPKVVSKLWNCCQIQ